MEQLTLHLPFLTCQGHIQEGISPSLAFVRGRVTKQAMLCWGQLMNTYMQATADQPAGRGLALVIHISNLYYSMVPLLITKTHLHIESSLLVAQSIVQQLVAHHHKPKYNVGSIAPSRLLLNERTCCQRIQQQSPEDIQGPPGQHKNNPKAVLKNCWNCVSSFVCTGELNQELDRSAVKTHNRKGRVRYICKIPNLAHQTGLKNVHGQTHGGSRDV